MLSQTDPSFPLKELISLPDGSISITLSGLFTLLSFHLLTMKFPVLSLTALLAFGGRTTCWINLLSGIDLYSFSLFLFKYVTMMFDSGLIVRRTSRLPVIQDAIVDPSVFTWKILPSPVASKMYKHFGFSEAT